MPVLAVAVVGISKLMFLSCLPFVVVVVETCARSNKIESLLVWNV